MNSFKLTLNIEEVILHQIQHSQSDSVFHLVNPMTPDLCGSLKIEGVRESFPKPVNQNGVDVLKRKPAATKSSPSEKKAKTSNSQTVPPNSLPAGATMGKVTPTFGTMPDGSIICPVCTTILRDMFTAKRHYESVHSGIVFVCELCQAELSRKDKMKAHLMKKHQQSSDTAKVIADRSQR